MINKKLRVQSKNTKYDNCQIEKIYLLLIIKNWATITLTTVGIFLKQNIQISNTSYDKKAVQR